MDHSSTITAKTIGNPSGDSNDPWSDGHPAEGERVAIFAFDVTNIDGSGGNIRTYHVAPVDQASTTALPQRADPQGITVQWTGYGTGTVVRAATRMSGADALMDPDVSAEAMFQCEVKPDDRRLGSTSTDRADQ